MSYAQEQAKHVDLVKAQLRRTPFLSVEQAAKRVLLDLEDPNETVEGLVQRVEDSAE